MTYEKPKRIQKRLRTQHHNYTGIREAWRRKDSPSIISAGVDGFEDLFHPL